MKVLTKENLLFLIGLDGRGTYDLKDLERLLERYGDDYFIEGNQFVKASDNQIMNQLLALYKETKHASQKI